MKRGKKRLAAFRSVLVVLGEWLREGEAVRGSVKLLNSLCSPAESLRRSRNKERKERMFCSVLAAWEELARRKAVEWLPVECLALLPGKKSFASGLSGCRRVSRAKKRIEAQVLKLIVRWGHTRTFCYNVFTSLWEMKGRDRKTSKKYKP